MVLEWYCFAYGMWDTLTLVLCVQKGGVNKDKSIIQHIQFLH